MDESEHAKGETIPPNLAPLIVERIEIRNFRGLGTLDVELEPVLTVLVGRNNSGKSRVLRALAVGLGALPPELDDLTVGSGDNATIDLFVAPRADHGSDEEVFDDDLARVLEPDTLEEDPFRQRFAWRVTVSNSAEGFGARSTFHRLAYRATGTWELPSNPTLVTPHQRRLFAAALIGTGRDLSDELTAPRSAIRRILGDLEIPRDQREEIEARLARLGIDIVEASASLRAVATSLRQAEAQVGTLGQPHVNPVPPHLEEVARSVSIDLDTGSGALPMRLHGAGPRSLASLQVQSVLYERRLGRDGPDQLPHPVTLIEEPEAHLHPQMQFELPTLVGVIPGQVVVTTHSSHLVTVVPPASLRLLRADGERASIIDLKPVGDDEEGTPRARRLSLHVDEMEKLKRLIERPFGELLFASAVVLGDGAMERAMLPPLIRHALRGLAHGVCVVDPSSMEQDLARIVVKFAELVDIPWYLFADSDGPGRRAVDSIVSQYSAVDARGQGRVVWVDEARGKATEAMMVGFDEALCRSALTSVRADRAADDDVLRALKDCKGSIGSTLAHEMIKRRPDPVDWPPSIRTLITRLERALSPPEDEWQPQPSSP